MIHFNNLRAYLLLFFVTIGIHSKAQQSKFCGTTVDDKTINYISQKLDKSNSNFRSRTDQALERLAISAHIIRRSDGSAGLTETQLISAIDKVNSYYSGANLEFFLFGAIDYIDNDDFSDYNTDLEDAVASTRDIPNTINIYFANSVSSGSSPLCGYAYFPGNPDRIFMDNSCTLNGTTLSHEIGHYLTLYHTHGKTNNGTTDELADGSNCATAGDDVCDTPADPNLSGKVNSNCQYTSNIRDANGQLYQPNTENIMSYSLQSCRRLFSSGQFDRAYQGFINFRNYITQKAYIADFKSEKIIACVGEDISFSDLSYGQFESLEWEFVGASVENSTESNPVISYTTPGIYDVSLTVTGEDGATDTKLVERAIEIVNHDDLTNNSIEYDFENNNIVDFHLLSPEDNYTFSVENVGKESDYSLSMQFFNYSESFKNDLILFDPLANPGNKDYIISFDYAFTYYSSEDASEAIDEVSLLYKSCDQEGEIWSANGKDDATANPSNKSFIPNQNEWRHIEKYVPVSENSDFVQLFFQSTNENGNNLYIDNVTVVFADAIVIRSLKITDEECAGDNSGQIIVDASFNGNEIEYSIDDQNYTSSGSFLNLEAGDYTLYIKSGNQQISENITIRAIRQRPAKPVILFSNDQLRLLASASEVEWYYNDQLVDDSGSTSIDFMGNGSYYVIVRNEVGCENRSEMFTILGHSEKITTDLTVIPNPTTGEIRLLGNINVIQRIQLFDALGREIEIKRSVDNSVANIHFLSSGIYLLKIELEDGGILLKKIIKD